MNGRPPEIPPHKLIASLRGYNLLPAIIFLPTRRKCDEAASEVAADKRQKTDPDKAARRQQMFADYAQTSPEVRSHKHAKILVNSGVASHHAGHIPSWKLLIEQMMSAGLLNAIFATSTVAAGVDFPARTVVITNADTRGNDGWRPLSANELHQMTGRAGRRGKDLVGFCVLVPGQFQDPKKIAELLRAQPDPLESKFRSTYTSLLNLLDAFGSFEQVREIAEKSYAFQETARQIEGLRRKRDKAHSALSASLDGIAGLTVDDLRGFERLASAKRRLEERLPATRAELRHRWLDENVTPGRIVTQGRSGKRLFLVISVRGDSVSSMRDDGQGRTFPLSRVNGVHERTYKLSDRDLENAFLETLGGDNPVVKEPKISHRQSSDEGAELIDRLLTSFVPDGVTGPERGKANEILWSAAQPAAETERLGRDIDHLRRDIWEPFEQRARVLNNLGYIDFASEAVTAEGKWLADLRVDRPLLVGEALRQAVFDGLEPAVLAGLMAALAADSDRNYGDLYLSEELLSRIADLEEVIYDVSRIEWRFGVEPSEEVNFSAAAAAEFWTNGSSWHGLVAKTGAEEGDLVRLLSRTGEALMQVAQLKESNPAAAALARETSEIILREPIR
jgi:ATP-dependent RNA helicase HelY